MHRIILFPINIVIRQRICFMIGRRSTMEMVSFQFNDRGSMIGRPVIISTRGLLHVAHTTHTIRSRYKLVFFSRNGTSVEHK